MKRKILIPVFALAVVACSALGLWPRFMLEHQNNNVAILSDYREISTLAKSSGLSIDEAIAVLKRNGLTGLMVSELIGDHFLHGIGQAEMKTEKDPATGSEGSTITINPQSEHYALLNKWLRLRFGISGGCFIFFSLDQRRYLLLCQFKHL